MMHRMRYICFSSLAIIYAISPRRQQSAGSCAPCSWPCSPAHVKHNTHTHTRVHMRRFPWVFLAACRGTFGFAKTGSGQSQDRSIKRAAAAAAAAGKNRFVPFSPASLCWSQPCRSIAPTRCSARRASCEKHTTLFSPFSYVCPEPVLVKKCILYINGSKSGVYRACSTATPATPRRPPAVCVSKRIQNSKNSAAIRLLTSASLGNFKARAFRLISNATNLRRWLRAWKDSNVNNIIYSIAVFFTKMRTGYNELKIKELRRV